MTARIGRQTVIFGLVFGIIVTVSRPAWPAPLLDSFSGTGNLIGGSAVSLFGTGFGVSPVVHFGNYATPLLSSSDTTGVFSVPSFSTMVAGSPFAIPMSVADNAGGVSNVLLFSYNAQPSLVSLSQASGPTVGGNLVSLLGNNFDQSGGLSVTFGGNLADILTVSPTSASLVAPPGTGQAQVVVSQFGLRSGSLEYRYVPTPVPEPTTALLAALGLAGLALQRRRWKQPRPWLRRKARDGLLYCVSAPDAP
jgi:MYXO-CTERM domain-containing protein